MSIYWDSLLRASNLQTSGYCPLALTTSLTGPLPKEKGIKETHNKHKLKFITDAQ